MMLFDTTVGWNPCWGAATATPTTIRTGDAVTGPAAVELEIVAIPSRPGCFAAYLPDGRGLIRASRQPARWRPGASGRRCAERDSDHRAPSRKHVDVGERPPAAAALPGEAPDQAAQDYLETFAPDRLPTTPTALAAPWGERRKVGCG